MREDEVHANPPPPEVLARLRRELNDDLLERVARFARRRVRLKRHAGIPCLESTAIEAENMANEAATLTVLGQRAWNPAVPLFEHLCGVVRSVSSHEVEQVAKQRHRPLRSFASDESGDAHAKLDAKISKNGPLHTYRPTRTLSLSDASEQLMQSLRVLAHGDAEVSALLDAFSDGAADAAEARQLACLSRDAYRNARRRLDRLIESLPDDIHDGAHDALEISYGY